MRNDIEKAELKISCEDKELIASGTFITFGPGETKLDIKYHDEELHFLFCFEESTTPVSPEQRFDVIDANTARLIFVNYHRKAFGVYTTNPVLLGTLANRNLFLVYHITYLQNTNRFQILYSFYLSFSRVK